MKKVFKKFLLGVFALFSLFIFTLGVNAASATISVKSNKSSVVQGDTVKVTVTISSSAALGAWQYTLDYNSSLFTLSASDVPLGYADSASNGTTKSKSYSYTFKSKSSGTAVFKVINTSIIGWDENKMTVTNGSTSVKVMTKEQVEASYSKNNYLSSLSVEGVSLSPSFNKETLEYNVTLPDSTTTIVVNATKEDSTASVAGAGTIEVSDGTNKITVTVTAQNGNERKYIINATVIELEPIIVVVNDETYSVVRKQDGLEKPSTFTETTVTIHGEVVPAFYSEITDYTVVGLKASDGTVKLFIYDEGNESFKLYEELNFKGIIFTTLPATESPKRYKESKITINGQELVCYIYDENSDFVLLYGINIETGHEGYYMYDKTENTLQRYNEIEINSLAQKNRQYLIVSSIFGGGLLISSLLLIILASKKTKKIKALTLIAKNNSEKNKVKE